VFSIWCYDLWRLSFFGPSRRQICCKTCRPLRRHPGDFGGRGKAILWPPRTRAPALSPSDLLLNEDLLLQFRYWISSMHSVGWAESCWGRRRGRGGIGQWCVLRQGPRHTPHTNCQSLSPRLARGVIWTNPWSLGSGFLSHYLSLEMWNFKNEGSCVVASLNLCGGGLWMYSSRKCTRIQLHIYRRKRYRWQQSSRCLYGVEDSVYWQT